MRLRSTIARNPIVSPQAALPCVVQGEPAPEGTIRHARRWADVLIPLALAVAGFAAAWTGAQRVPPWVVQNYGFIDQWFETDLPRVYEDMNRLGTQKATTQHPLFPLMTYPLVRAARAVGQLDPLAAVRVVMALTAAGWLAALFFVLRLIGCRRTDAAVFSLLGGLSASAIFGFVVPETWPLGSLTMLIALGTVAWAAHRALPPVWTVMASALTFSVTITNWMAGLFAAFIQYPWRRALQLSAQAFLLVVLLWWAQARLFPTARFFLRARVNTTWVMQPESAHPLRVMNAFIFHPMVMPAIQVVEQQDRPWRRMTVQPSRPGSATPWGAAAVLLWAALLGLGGWGWWQRMRTDARRVPVMLGLLLAGQLGLHMVYGAEETFLYALHWAPLLIVLAALGTLTRARLVALALAAALAVCAGINNVRQFGAATAFAQSEMTPAQAVRRAMAERPSDPWPRADGHVLLALPGSAVQAKAYHEPGGSFSPGVGSFGVSIWITDPDGAVRTTSDTMPRALIHQRFIYEDGAVPAVETETIDYRARWAVPGAGTWILTLEPSMIAQSVPVLAVRSVGPAGGTITALEWDGARLLINGRYKLTVSPLPRAVHIGAEGSTGWMTNRSELTHWNGADGWGHARLALAGPSQVTIRDTMVVEPGPRLAVAPQALEVELPDPQFAASLYAQTAHLLMGLVDRETRPGDPMSASRERLREAAYITAALARAGQWPAAQALGEHLAGVDEPGASPEAPGLILWTLEEIANRVREPALDQSLWPHARRQAEQILAAQGGLIPGIDRRARLMVAALSYRGLLDAAALADRVHQLADAVAWRAAAGRLQVAWLAAFASQPSHNELTATSAMWPSGVAAPEAARFLGMLEARWAAFHDADGNFASGGIPYTPQRLAPEISEAHQWLWLGRIDRMWATLGWLWQHDASPGLYVWPEGRPIVFDPEGNFQRSWERVRGWIDRPQVMPSYWTAAELLLLQLDMLAYVEESGGEPTLVIGAGIPAAWLAQPMRVQGLSTRLGTVDWRWDNGQMDVTVHGLRCRVRLGPSFEPGTPVAARFLAPERS